MATSLWISGQAVTLRVCWPLGLSRVYCRLWRSHQGCCALLRGSGRGLTGSPSVWPPLFPLALGTFFGILALASDAPLLVAHYAGPGSCSWL